MLPSISLGSKPTPEVELACGSASMSSVLCSKTAKLAAIHSKSKQISGVCVDYCPISYVKKPNGSQPGFVIYKNHKTIKL